MRRSLLGPVFVLVLATGLGLASAATGTRATPAQGRIIGRFASASSCFGCGDLTKYIHADDVWCAWQGSNVIVHVRFRNASIEHVTISWHPSYTVRDGGSHGTGLTSIQSSGVNAHASRGVFVKQQPQGVPPGSPLASCDPSFSDVESG
jgi:hypothetical protein